MKRVLILYFSLLIYGCNAPRDENTSSVSADTATNGQNIQDSLKATTSRPDSNSKDTVLLLLSVRILRTMRSRDYQSFSSFVHPAKGVRFSPYGYIDTAHHLVLTAARLGDATIRKGKKYWGSFDGTGDSILLDIDHYFADFAYGSDFLNAPQRAVNRFLGNGNSFNNLETAYPSADFTEFYFPGFDKRYEGMDWSTIRLVFEEYHGRYFLVGIVGDRWTI
jgi:hypothetical protein